MSYHEKSCLLDCFAHVIGIPAEHLAVLVGHDGRSHGFHTQELIEVADRLGYTITAIERDPIGINPDTMEHHPVEFPGGNDLRFTSHIKESEGVLLGRNCSRRTHALAWKDNVAYDPAGSVNTHYVFSCYDGVLHLNEMVFDPIVFLKVRKL